MLKQKGIVIQRTRIEDVTDCFSSKNSDYRLLSINGNTLREFQKYYIADGSIKTQKYLIECFDDINLENIDEYLQAEESNYRLTRLKDQMVVRLSHEDKIKFSEIIKNGQDNKISRALIEEKEVYEEVEIRKEKHTGKVKTFIKKIISR